MLFITQSRKRGRNEHYVKPNRPGPGADRSSDEHLVLGRVWGNVGAVILLVLFVNIVLVVSGKHCFQTNVEEGEKELSI